MPNALIAMSGRLPQLRAPESDANSLAQVMRIGSMADQQRLNRLQFQEAQRAASENQLVNKLFAESVGPDGQVDRGRLTSGFASQGLGSRLPGLQKQFAEQDKAQGDVQKQMLELAKQRSELAGQAFGAVRQNPTVENVHATLDHLAQLQAFTPQAVAHWKGMVNPQNAGAFADQMFRMALGAKEQLAKIETRDTGGAVQTLATDPVTMQQRTLGTVQKTQSPDSVASTAIQRDRLAEDKRHRGVTEKQAADRLQFDQGVAVADAGGPSQALLTKQFGKAPNGFRWKPDGTQEAIPGGPADIKSGELGAKAKSRAQHAASQAQVVIDTIDKALGNVGLLETGLTGSVMGKIPGTDAYNLRRQVDTVKANIGFDSLQKMREMSPTGGALGQVAVQELSMLQATIGNLDANQSEEELVSNLNAAKKHYEGWKNAVLQAAGGNVPPAPAAGGGAPDGWSIQRVN